MSFDPEKVERFDLDDDVYGNHPDPGGRYVRASDFDQLLALWRDVDAWKKKMLEGSWGDPEPCASARAGKP